MACPEILSFREVKNWDWHHKGPGNWGWEWAAGSVEQSSVSPYCSWLCYIPWCPSMGLSHLLSLVCLYILKHWGNCKYLLKQTPAQQYKLKKKRGICYQSKSKPSHHITPKFFQITWPHLKISASESSFNWDTSLPKLLMLWEEKLPTEASEY